MKIVYSPGTGEITEKKSRFIATVRPVKTEEEAAAFFAEIKKKYWDARHNCTAFVLGDRQQITRSSDDGEPAGTAGHPMLDVLLGEGLTDVAVTVTRYFGGVLLGTGGLVRAYQAAVREGLSNCTVIENLSGRILTVETDYNGIGKLQYLFAKENITVKDTKYADSVVLELVVEEDRLETVKKAITETSAGTAQIRVGDPVSFALTDGKLLFIS